MNLGESLIKYIILQVQETGADFTRDTFGCAYDKNVCQELRLARRILDIYVRLKSE